MSNQLPDPSPRDNELDQVIRHYGNPSAEELNKSLKQRLEQAKQRYIKRQYDRLDREGREQDRGQGYSR